MPLALFRGSILIACLALVLGVAGIFYVQHRDAQRRPATGVATVQIGGLDSIAGIQVLVTWTDAAGAEQSETGRPAPNEGQWIFRRAPEGKRLTLIVYRREQGQRLELARQPAFLTYGGLFEAYPRPTK